jgi:uncharacterized protein (DUF885 family)
MTVSKFSISLQPDVAEKIQARRERFEAKSIERSVVINKSLDRYFFILDQARRRLAELLTDGEIGLILDVLNGTLFAEPFSIQLVPAEIEDSFPDGYTQKWKVDGPALVMKLRGLSYAELVSLVDAVERWWNRVSAGEQPGHGEALKK